MLKVARAALFAVLPAELLLMTLLISGVSLPVPVIVVAELAVVSVFVLEAVTAYRLFRSERRGGAGRRAALLATFHRLVPVQVRKVTEFELKGMASLVLWMGRRRNGVPSGATAVPYSKEQTPLLLVILFAMIVETVAVDLLLIALDVSDGLRVLVLVIDLYGIVFGLALGAACVTRPHVVTPDELRIRYGAYFDLRVPRELISSVRLSRNYNESGMVTAVDGRLGVAVSSQTNVIVELTEPITAVRPLGGRVEVTTIRFFADTPNAALNALRPLQPRDAP
ncbi:hypothetical protein [Streptosporangium sp. 'caverna']|uniref:hypothetical protein n=1 Tax=Streptosporangium sp. 'caverna' TaxID=2202249 RepID=UPI000D7E7985|nr:hypothetical protein [Streptosporangium sp. 'caverna']AWS43285.1 hypothetical protein DKM19_19790 [Streptosporangium sp. 'caverna']